jgi:hypothetical protein
MSPQVWNSEEMLDERQIFEYHLIIENEVVSISMIAPSWAPVAQACNPCY